MCPSNSYARTWFHFRLTVKRPKIIECQTALSCPTRANLANRWNHLLFMFILNLVSRGVIFPAQQISYISCFTEPNCQREDHPSAHVSHISHPVLSLLYPVPKHTWLPSLPEAILPSWGYKYIYKFNHWYRMDQTWNQVMCAHTWMRITHTLKASYWCCFSGLRLEYKMISNKSLLLFIT